MRFQGFLKFQLERRHASTAKHEFQIIQSITRAATVHVLDSRLSYGEFQVTNFTGLACSWLLQGTPTAHKASVVIGRDNTTQVTLKPPLPVRRKRWL